MRRVASTDGGQPCTMTAMDPTQAPRFETKDVVGAGVSAEVKQRTDADDVVVEHQHDDHDDERTSR